MFLLVRFPIQPLAAILNKIILSIVKQHQFDLSVEMVEMVVLVV